MSPRKRPGKAKRARDAKKAPKPLPRRRRNPVHRGLDIPSLLHVMTRAAIPFFHDPLLAEPDVADAFGNGRIFVIRGRLDRIASLCGEAPEPRARDKIIALVEEIRGLLAPPTSPSDPS